VFFGSISVTIITECEQMSVYNLKTVYFRDGLFEPTTHTLEEQSSAGQRTLW